MYKNHIVIQTRLCPGSANLREGVKAQPKVILDLNLDFPFPDWDLYVCWITSKILWIHHVVGVSHFTKCETQLVAL